MEVSNCNKTIKSKLPNSGSSFADVEWCKCSCLASFRASLVENLLWSRLAPHSEQIYLLSCIWVSWENGTPSEWTIVQCLPPPIDKSRKWFTTVSKADSLAGFTINGSPSTTVLLPLCIQSLFGFAYELPGKMWKLQGCDNVIMNTHTSCLNKAGKESQ